MFNGPVEDRLAIRELNDSYAHAVFRRDAEAWIAHWEDDAVWNLAGQQVTGKPAILATWKQAMAQFTFVAFFAAPGEISVAKDQAKARIFTSEVLVGADGTIRRVLGQYDDEMVRRMGRWFYSRRVYTLLHAS